MSRYIDADKLISRQAAIDALDEIESEVADGYGYQYEKWRKYFCELPSAQPERNDRLFVELVVEYPSISTYKEYKGKPYFSIKYIENGEEYIGYGTYKPEVLSRYLKEYFMPSAQPERKKGEWQKVDEQPYFRKHFHKVCCSVCRKQGYDYWNFCPNCGADMRGES